MPLHNGGWVKRVGRAWYQFLRPIAISCSYLKWTINTELDRYFESLYYRSSFGSARQNWRVFLLFPTFFCHPFLVHKILFFRFVLFLICTGSVLLSYQLRVSASRMAVNLWQLLDATGSTAILQFLPSLSPRWFFFCLNFKHERYRYPICF